MILHKGSLSIQDKKTISLAVGEGNFPWFWYEKTIKPQEDYVQPGGFVHVLFSELKVTSPKYFYLVEIIIKELLTNEEIKSKFKFEKIVRAQANLLCNIENDAKNTAHQDFQDEDYFSVVYYPVDSDGDTLIFNDQKDVIDRESPKEGNYIIIKSNQLHGMQTPKYHKKRIAFNIVLSGEIVNK
jgi:hypothetical protein